MRNKNTLGWAACALTAALPAAFATAGGAGGPPGAGYELLVDEQFKGDRLDEKRWEYRVGPRTGLNINGMNVKEAVTQKDGELSIRASTATVDGQVQYLGGGILSKALFGYGYYEVRAQPFMGGHGVHSAFWQRGVSTPGYFNTIFEIDSFEIDSPIPLTTKNLYVIPNGYGRPEAPWPHRANVPVVLDRDGWMVDGYDYAPQGITFYGNGKAIAFTPYSDDFPDLVAQQNVWLTALNGVGKVDADKQPGITRFSYFRFYAKDYPGYNLLPNGGFEYNRTQVPLQTPVAWREAGSVDASTVVRGDARDGQAKLRHGHGAPYKVSTWQTLENIRNGEYAVSLWYRSSAAIGAAELRLDSGKATRTRRLAPAPDWRQVSLRLPVGGNGLRISLNSEGEGAQFVEFDDITIMKPARQAVQAVRRSYDPAVSPAWRLFETAPVRFVGDETFYFFDRNLGLGDAITVQLSVTPDALQNAMPIMRAPKDGQHGWAIGMTEAGQAYCQVGSLNQHARVMTGRLLEAGRTTRLSCVVAGGQTRLYADGRLAASADTSAYGTRDEKAAGRLGATTAWFDAVGEVTAASDHAVVRDASMRNFRGQMAGVRIYNRALSDAELQARD